MSPKIIDAHELAAREEIMMQAALNIMERDGVAGLTIDKVVAQVPFSKGTVYNHFTCKEDLLTGLCNRCVTELTKLFKRAVEFDGTTRERMLAIGFSYMLHSLLHPTEFMLVISAKTPAVREKSTLARQEQHTQLENELLGNLLSIISDALASGDLILQPHLSPAQVAFSLWSMSFGTIALLHESVDRCSIREDMQIEQEFANNVNILLDGLQWQPFTPNYPWGETIERFRQDTFKDEVSQLMQKYR